MKTIYALSLIMVLFIAACAQEIQQGPQNDEIQKEAVITSDENTDTVETQKMDQEKDTTETRNDKTTAVKITDDKQTPTKLADGADIRILSKGSFEPLESKVKTGTSIRWINDNEKEISLTIFQGKKWHVNSDVIAPGESFEYVFDEPGEYEFWTIGFGPQGAKLTVE